MSVVLHTDFIILSKEYFLNNPNLLFYRKALAVSSAAFVEARSNKFRKRTRCKREMRNGERAYPIVFPKERITREMTSRRCLPNPETDLLLRCLLSSRRDALPIEGVSASLSRPTLIALVAYMGALLRCHAISQDGYECYELPFGVEER